MSVNKRKRDLLKAARALDPKATLETTGATQIRISIHGPKGTEFVICSNTPGDHREFKNFKRDLRKIARNVGLMEPLERANDN